MIWLLLPAIAATVGCLWLWIRIRRSEIDFAEKLAKTQEANEQLAAHAANYHQKLRALSDSSGAGMVILDQAGRVVHANATAERILNAGRDDLVGHALIQATLSSELQQFIERASNSGHPLTQDFQMPG